MEKYTKLIFRLYCTSRPTKSTHKIVMVRHGESEWNEKNLFCGWYDAKLSEKGTRDANLAGKALKDAGYQFDIAYTSFLSRAQKTLDVILKAVNQPTLKVEKTWRLNERHYGCLTGREKVATIKKYGEAQVQIWRRSYNICPPAMDAANKYYKSIVEDKRYENCFKPGEFPMTESLELNLKRAVPYCTDTIWPQVTCGKRVLIAAHGTTLRGIVKHLDSISDSDITKINVPNGIPFFYELDENMKPVKSMKFLGDERTIQKAIAAAASPEKAKK